MCMETAVRIIVVISKHRWDYRRDSHILARYHEDLLNVSHLGLAYRVLAMLNLLLLALSFAATYAEITCKMFENTIHIRL